MDADSQERLKRFYHKKDSFRGLVGRLLPRMLLRERGFRLEHMTFGRTENGKPYIATPGLSPPIAYNVTHDSGLIAVAYESGQDIYPDPPAYRVGIDVMKLQLPRRETFAAFVELFSDQLTALEKHILLPSPPLAQQEALRRFYLIWTLKEAYTKALGLGLGFDFKRIEYDVPRDGVRIDGAHPSGWEFVRFEVRHGADEYVGVAARFVGGAGGGGRVEARGAGAWLQVEDGAGLVSRAVSALGE
ncbi:4'-phosphopantetheinyl transferase [Wolfiporia cocos MD-104 SS10]|uniref:holo-[acyl-carrier-protein] synthase n=1 Tax=Wolfiporia cocos (strain MD-104) TaxID=742152 RepID=A0A2H3JHN1_WOLCO|nr:4'-phosphopantetheinyl transferase [Wolfiporia cocos MD-104 SS10]